MRYREAKADVPGLYMLQYLYDHKLMDGAPAGAEAVHHVLASVVRTLRFGLKDAHGKGMGCS